MNYNQLLLLLEKITVLDINIENKIITAKGKDLRPVTLQYKSNQIFRDDLVLLIDKILVTEECQRATRIEELEALLKKQHRHQK